MTPEDFREFVTLLGRTAEVYGRPLPPDGALTVMFNALADCTLEEIRAALTAHIRSCKFMPRPADLLEQIRGSEEDRARAAWHRALDACRRVGTWNSVYFDDPAVHYAVERLGGWPALGAVCGEDLPFREKDFCYWYARAERADLAWDAVPPVLIGQHHLLSRGGLFPPPLPVPADERTAAALPRGPAMAAGAGAPQGVLFRAGAAPLLGEILARAGAEAGRGALSPECPLAQA
jgi:hypothetical protein